MESIFISVFKVEHSRANRFVIFIAIDWSFCIIKVIYDRRNHQFIFTMQNDKLYTFVNEWELDKMPFMAGLRIDRRTKEMLNITSSQKTCVI